VLAGAYNALGLRPDALATIRRGLAIAPEFAGLHLQLGYVLLADERPADALVVAERARELASESSATAALVAAVLCDLGRLADADAAVEEALRLDPENADAHQIKGVLALRRGGGKAAVQAQRTAVRLDPTDAGAREGLTIALKTRNPVYGTLLRFQLWLGTRPTGVRVAVSVAPFVMAQVLRPYLGQTWAKVVLGVVLGLVVLSWAIEPVMNCVLLLSRDRLLVNGPTRVATAAFVTFVAAAIACFVASSAGGLGRLVLIAIGFLLWALATGHGHRVRPGWRKPLVAGAAAGAALGAIAIVATVVAAPGAPLVTGLALFSGILAIWFTKVS
jgi:tetratricopeptide (TPR) repeat protein